jgi:hypothetical protein
MDNTFNPDCSVECVDGMIPYHKSHLMLYSDYFRLYFSNIKKNCFNDSENVIVIDYHIRPFQIVTNYVYQLCTTNELFTKEDYEQALMICDTYLYDSRIQIKILGVYNFICGKNNLDKTIAKLDHNCVYMTSIDNEDLVEVDINYLDIHDVWKPSLINKDKINQFSSDLCSSFTYKTEIVIHALLEKKIDYLVKKNLHNVKNYVLSFRGAKILKYVPGSKMGKHKDHIKSRSDPYDYSVEIVDIGRVLLINYSEDAEGGELMVAGDMVASPELCKFNKWNIYVIPSGVLHEVCIVKKGIRLCVVITIEQYRDIYDSDESDNSWDDGN